MLDAEGWIEFRAGEEESNFTGGRRKSGDMKVFYERSSKTCTDDSSNETKSQCFNHEDPHDETSLSTNSSHGSNLCDPLDRCHRHCVVDDHQRHQKDDEDSDKEYAIEDHDKAANQSTRTLPVDHL